MRLPGYLPPRPARVSRWLWLRAYLASWRIARRTRTSEEAREQGSDWVREHGGEKPDPWSLLHRRMSDG